MNELLREPLCSWPFESSRALLLEPSASYIFCFSPEERSRLAPDWMQRNADTLFVELIPDENKRAMFSWRAGERGDEVRLRSESDLDRFVVELGRQCVYVDITGLPHFVWVPLIRSFLRNGLNVHVVYAEPRHYVAGRNTPAVGIYELSDRISNAEPLPGFASLARETTPSILVSLLGFEGGRFARVQEIVQTTGERTFPIIGVPGFEPEYPFIAYYGNRLPLRASDCWLNITFASANCPFALLAQLEHLEAQRFPEDATIKVALIGTKPHALGALLYFLRSERDIELVYDHPVRSAGRTTGSTRCWVYSVSELAYRSQRLTSLL
jgi:hypothetical protein